MVSIINDEKDPAAKTFLITKEWLFANSAAQHAKAWVTEQFLIVGAEKRKGWMDDVVGSRLTWSDKERFESFRFQEPKGNVTIAPDFEPKQHKLF